MTDAKTTVTLTITDKRWEYTMMKVTLDQIFVDTLPKRWESPSRAHLKARRALEFVEGEDPCDEAGCHHD